MTAPVLQLRPGPVPGKTIDQLWAELLTACRHRTGLDPEEFAEVVAQLVPRRTGLVGAAVRAAEAGVHPVATDVALRMLRVAGVDVVGWLQEALRVMS